MSDLVLLISPAYLHANTRNCVGQYFAAFQPMVSGVPKTHGRWILKFPTHESAHGPLRRALALRITLELVPDLRNSPVWGNFGDTFLETKIGLLQSMQGPLTGQIQKSLSSNWVKLVEQTPQEQGAPNV